jgi:hypothetical protein
MRHISSTFPVNSNKMIRNMSSANFKSEICLLTHLVPLQLTIYDTSFSEYDHDWVKHVGSLIPLIAINIRKSFIDSIQVLSCCLV